MPSEAILQYCRTARRLRHRLRHAPAALHLSLRSLKPATPVEVQRVPTILDAPPAERFALLVRYSLIGTLLPYSARQALIRKAGRMGIKRFDANLIIAMVQHRAGGSSIGAEPNRRGSGWIWWVAMGLQIAIAAGIYRLLR